MVPSATIFRCLALFSYFAIAAPVVGIFGFLLFVALVSDASSIGYYFEEFYSSFAWVALPAAIGGLSFVVIVTLLKRIRKHSLHRTELACLGALSMSSYFVVLFLKSLLDPPSMNRWLLLSIVVSAVIGAVLGMVVPKTILPSCSEN